MTPQAKCPVCGAEQADWLACQRCTGKLRRRLSELPDLYRELAVQFTRQSQNGTGNGGKGAETALPFDGAAAELRAEIVNTLGTWVRDIGGDNPPANHSVKTWCDWLGVNMHLVRGHQAVDEMFDEITSLAKRAERAVDQPTPRLWCGPCPMCGSDMYAAKGRQTVVCRRCAEVLPEGEVAQEWDVHGTRQAMIDQLRDTLATEQELVDAVPRAFNVRITVRMVQHWVNTGRLLKVGTRHGRPTYSIATAVVLASERAARGA